LKRRAGRKKIESGMKVSAEKDRTKEISKISRTKHFRGEVSDGFAVTDESITKGRIMLGSNKRRFSAKLKGSCDASLSYKEAKKYFHPEDKMRSAMKKVVRKAERQFAKAEISRILEEG
jgi:hypothetical protein